MLHSVRRALLPCGSHVPRVKLASEEDEVANPLTPRMLGPQAVMRDTAMLAHLIVKPVVQRRGISTAVFPPWVIAVLVATNPPRTRGCVNDQGIIRRNRRVTIRRFHHRIVVMH